MSSKYELITRWYYFPALLWLAASLLVGIWIRVEWHQPFQSFFSMQNLIHTHSHASLLGWVYIVFAGFTLQHFIRKSVVQKIAAPMAAGLHLSNAGMFISFALQGYAFWSILFSTIHLILTLWLAVLYLICRKSSVNDLMANFTGAGWLWLVLSGFGPFALAFSGGMAGQWALFWLGSYLYLLTNGWVLFMLMAVLISTVTPGGKYKKWADIGFNLMFWSLPGSMLSMFYVISFPEWTMWAGWIFNIAFTAGTLMTILFLLNQPGGVSSYKILFYSGVMFLAAKSVIQIIAFYPELLYLSTNHHLKVAFLHLFLVGCTSLLLIYAVYKPAIPGTGYFNSAALIITGSVLMIMLLFMMPGLPMLGVFLFIPYQLLIALSGLLIITGIIWITFSYRRLI